MSALITSWDGQTTKKRHRLISDGVFSFHSFLYGLQDIALNGLACIGCGLTDYGSIFFFWLDYDSIQLRLMSCVTSSFGICAHAITSTVV